MTDGAVKKHRHDLGQEDHGPVFAAGTTRGIQVVLGLWIAGTVLAILWSMTEAGRGPSPVAPPGPASHATQPR